MAQSNWEADKMLDVYIYDYFMKRNFQSTAKAFMAEAKVAAEPVAIDAPGGFLLEWWSVFWDIFIARTNEKHSEVAAAYLEAQQLKAKEQQLQMQQLQLIQQRHVQMQRRDANHQSFNGPINAIGSDGILGPSTATVLAAKLYQEQMKHTNGLDSKASPQLLDAGRMAMLNSATNHPGQLIQGNAGNVSAALQQIQARTQQSADIKGEMGVGQRSLPMDPSSMYGQGIIQSKSGIGSAAGLSQGVSGMPLKGWPLTGLDQIRPNLGPQMQKPFIPTQNQFQHMSPQQQQQILAQAQGTGNLPNYGDLDPQRFRGLTRANLAGKEGQQGLNDGSVTSVGSPMQSNSPNVRLDQSEHLMKMKPTHMQQSLVQPQQEQMQQQQQLQQTTRKRKQTSSSGAANSTGTGNTVGPSNSAPSTPSTHTPGDGMAMGGNLQHVNNMSKSLMMYGADGAGVLASSSNQMGDLEHFPDVGSLDDNVESFLSHDDADARDIFSALKASPAEHKSELTKGFTFSEVGCTRASNNKIVCCHFSSDGKLLASAGHEKKVFLWNMDTKQTESTPEDHTLIITDVRFRPNSTHLATSSLDRTVRLWNAAEPNFCLHTYSGHTSQVTSLDFHPKKTDLLCSSDGISEIRFWNVGQYSCSHISKCGAAQVRFQPRVGQLLAAAAENTVSIFDVETDRKTLTLQDHNTEVHSVCWDANGEYLASVSQDYVKVWSIVSGECIHELSSNGNKFHSCVFHPTYTSLLVIGGYQSLALWNMVENRTMSVQAHDGLIAALAQSPLTGMVASGSHDKSVKLWK
ncbi:transcriptional corepressor LEUNIG_HOMOLOG-like isoform X1 [Dioscorea cayenensis subsp. rotundata]|uniref:Transcriptional corepressor LEUNIG_HOMOLOG-like isoform X1 n=1 Tax=Dioscorea cayennensis subsp. rotundata TaxID=55577 RepID=A0AB40CDL1_DIOCR|nr:transcriptional corepressor LEUNIG_HOMOLOG-like isoform X1 [Dioscorea cayenensis subsp. rotundata]